jgi:hypothetical protein
MVQGVQDKEMIAGELAASEAHISSTMFGQILLQRCCTPCVAKRLAVCLSKHRGGLHTGIRQKLTSRGCFCGTAFVKSAMQAR